MGKNDAIPLGARGAVFLLRLFGAIISIVGGLAAVLAILWNWRFMADPEVPILIFDAVAFGASLVIVLALMAGLIADHIESAHSNEEKRAALAAAPIPAA